MLKTDRALLIETELENFQFDTLKEDDVIEISVSTTLGEMSDKITILAITGKLFGISNCNSPERFYKWVTLFELKRWITICADTNLIYGTALYINFRRFDEK